ncbi:hypothetical protein HK097_000726 [Rhizophlyctis rosea]|uniref:Ribosomal L1 domain-containing protein 1 n=1 Tax=Rhizophlyctis rosea TaxID=64517 RepID=A0AAD5WZB6_9FUNG|nr:hypothetical protein HK097_000726 [Rhizophlyctis rosea]
MSVDATQVSKAAKALLAFAAKQKAEREATNPLIEGSDNEYVILVVATKKMPEKIRVKPVRIPLRHSLLDEKAEVCLISKDPQRTYKDLLAAKGVTRVSKVIGVQKLKAKYKPYEAKRQLVASYDLFLADEKVLAVLPPILGKAFFSKKKHPAPVDMTKNNLLGEIDSAIAATYLHLNKGVCNAIKIGTTGFTADQITENVTTAIQSIVNAIPQKWRNVQSIHLKTTSSVALPLYNSLPDAPEEEAEAEGEVAAMEVEKEEEEKKVDVGKKVVKKAGGKGGKKVGKKAGKA